MWGSKLITNNNIYILRCESQSFGMPAQVLYILLNTLICSLPLLQSVLLVRIEILCSFCILLFLSFVISFLLR